jgi:hypothetical protein
MAGGNVGLGGGGALGLALETTSGTYAAPTVWIPITSETFRYVENRYFSPQLRQQVMVSDVKQGYYHIEGDVTFEVDPNFFPYFLYMSRHTITKTGASAPYTYKAVPNKVASLTQAVAGSARTASITIIRNNIEWAYTGCGVGQYSFTINNGVLECTMTLLGNGETEPASGAPHTPTWQTPDLYGADAHAIFVASDFGVSPTFGAASVDFNGITLVMNHNAAAQNRIVKNRAASYISFGETDVTFTTELDFVDDTEYNNFKNTTQRGIKLESTQGANPFATATDGVQIQLNRFAYETYDVGLPAMGDLIMAGVTGRGLAIAGGDAYQISCKSPANIT